MIPFLDLGAEHRYLASEIREAMDNVLTSGKYILSREVSRFEHDFARAIGTPHIVAVGSGTDALTLALTALGVGAGDKVITTPLTFVATAEAICRLSATPVFIDVDPRSLTIGVEALAARLTSDTAAVVPVHLYGNARGIEDVITLCDHRGIPVVEDAAQALGARSGARAAGSFGAFGAFSFHPTKNLGAYGDGGAIAVRSAEDADVVKRLRNHGSRDKVTYDFIGFNSRLDELQAAVLNVKLQTLDRRLATRRAVAESYRAGLSGLPLVLPAPDDDSSGQSWNYYTVTTPLRDHLARYLGEQGISTAVYYPRPLHLQPAYRHLGYREGDFPHAERASGEVLSLPCHPALTEDDIDSVVKAVKSFFRSGRRTTR